MGQLTINGKALDFKPGETIIQVAMRNQIEIPYYCWHPRLSIAANCRMCLVEIEKMPKLAPACQTPCRDGMAVQTQSAKVSGAQKAVHEFLLINHPIDCPICDQAGECKLQDYYMKFQLDHSPMADHKVHKPRLEPLGPTVMYNAERCIVCTRCVRFMDEVAKDRQLGVFNRGDHCEIGTMPGDELDSAYSLNTVDVCPVGALTSRAFRFKQRAWNLKRSPSVCPSCARGCNTSVDHRSEQVYRILPRENEAVNKSWMCDEGRLAYKRTNNDRLAQGLVRERESVVAVPAPIALRAAIDALKPLTSEHRQVGLALSLHATCEEAYIAGRFAQDVLQQDGITVFGYADGAADPILRLADKNPNRRGIRYVLEGLGLAIRSELPEGLEGLIVVGNEGDKLAELARTAQSLAAVVHIAASSGPFGQVAHATLPGLAWVQLDGTWVNGDDRAQALRPAFGPQGDARPNHTWILQLAEGLGLTYPLPSPQTIRAEMERRLDAFKTMGLTQLPSTGAPLKVGSA